MRYAIAFFQLALLATPALADTSATTSTSANGTVRLDDRRDIARRAPVIPRAQAVAVAVRRVPGKVMDAALETNDGIRTWQIDILAGNARRVRLWLDAANGEILRTAER